MILTKAFSIASPNASTLAVDGSKSKNPIPLSRSSLKKMCRYPFKRSMKRKKPYTITTLPQPWKSFMLDCLRLNKKMGLKLL